MARVILTYDGTVVTASITARSVIEFPITATSARFTIRAGMAIMASITLMMIMSMIPPK